MYTNNLIKLGCEKGAIGPFFYRQIPSTERSLYANALISARLAPLCRHARLPLSGCLMKKMKLASWILFASWIGALPVAAEQALTGSWLSDSQFKPLPDPQMS